MKFTETFAYIVNGVQIAMLCFLAMFFSMFLISLDIFGINKYK